MLLSVRAAGDAVHEDPEQQAPSQLHLTTGSLVVRPKFELPGESGELPLKTGSLNVALTAALQPDGSSIMIATGALVLDVMVERSTSAVAIATGPTDLRIATEQDITVRVRTGNLDVALTPAPQPPSAIAIPTGSIRLRTEPLTAMRDIVVNMRMRLEAEQRPGAMTARTGPLNVSMTMDATEPPAVFGFSRDLVISGDAAFPAGTLTQPVLLGIRLEDAAFRSVAHGGNLRWPNAGDIEFVQIGGTGAVLPHNIVSHVTTTTTGVIVFDLTLPTWNVQQDFRVRMNYGSNVGEGAWWNLPIRSERASASGTSFWYDRSDTDMAAPDLAAEESDVALIDAMAGSSVDNDRSGAATWDALLGGPIPGPLISIDTHFDWRTEIDFGFGHCVNHLPPGGGWLFWVMPTIPREARTHPWPVGDARRRAIWDEILAGNHDVRYITFGQRLAAKIDASGHPRYRLILDANHEMNQSNDYRVYAETVDLYRMAMQRTIDKIREGAGFHVRFCHRPGYRPETTKIGDYVSFVPNNVDMIGLGLHPAADCDSEAAIDALFAGTLNAEYYGIDELLGTAADMGLPIAFPEWSPAYSTVSGGPCPVANSVITKFFNQVIVPNRAIMVADCIYHQNIRDPAAYTGTGTGLTQWQAMVNTRKVLWSGIKSVDTPPQNLTAPSITGSTAVNSILTCNDGQWIGAAPISFTRRWRRDGFDFTPAFTDPTYTTVEADIGTIITCRVIAENALGSLSVTSNGITVAGTIVPTAPENEELPLITGLSVVGSELFCSTGEWTGTEPIEFTRRWLRNAVNEVAESTKIQIFPMEIDDPGARTVTQPSFASNSSNVITAGANQIIDWRGRDGLQHTPGQTGGHEAAFPNRICTYVINTATATSVFCGGKCHAALDNAAYLNGTWAHCHGNEDFGFNEPGLQVRSSPAGCKFQGFYLKDCADGIKLWNQYGPEIEMPQAHSPTFENICIINCRDDCIEDDALVGGIFRNCYLQGHSILSWRPGPPITNPHVNKVVTFEYCLMHMDRQRYDGDEKWHAEQYDETGADGGATGSRKVGKWIDLDTPNDDDIANYRSANGWAHKWFFKPQGNNLRMVMRHCMLRIDTMPVEGAGEFQIFPNNAASSYEDVDVIWLGPGAWPFAQSQATLASMGINLITDPTVGFPLWQETKEEWFLLNGYDSNPASPTFDTFKWNWTASDIIPGALGAANPYITIAADVGADISCRVTATNVAAPDGVVAISSNAITVMPALDAPMNQIRRWSHRQARLRLS